MGKPAPDKVAYLQALDIVAPPTRSSCRKIIDFIRDGNTTQGGSETERIALLREKQERYLGKRIWAARRPQLCGTVLYVIPRSATDIHMLRDADPNRDPCSFDAFVRWDNRRSWSMSLAYVVLVPQT